MIKSPLFIREGQGVSLQRKKSGTFRERAGVSVFPGEDAS